MSCIQEKIIGEIQDSIEAKQKVLDNFEILKTLELMADQITETLKKGGKILLCGNGGSASDALHFAGEIVGRFQKERKAYNAIALNADVATMTAIANDYGYDQVFSRQVEGLMTDKDVLIGISTSGNSKNIIKAVEKAHEIGGKAYLFSGKDGGKLKDICDLCIIAPSDVTTHIQEVHECLYHILCGLIENAMIEVYRN
ncbi:MULTISPECIES: D-sedoheptulose-7-phosphate isomerase [Eisenbergiella]|uniref:Phosphoheptose isomerase n=1 Tax=Eisenbergiella porci TaxID=2652274 RepID=A0A6N7VXT0_9FIRM|nr:MULTISPECIES: D-sedoheptulose 7-phosphate isomerase [Eisenbergiella]MDY2653672.1 D-sedoheptulose 7-phosphate isomerase [Eisenbergiella porci]MSS87062.1 D-sedoheptulose 7-phosphate isomerase [Eisenbergiella porci]